MNTISYETITEDLLIIKFKDTCCEDLKEDLKSYHLQGNGYTIKESTLKDIVSKYDVQDNDRKYNEALSKVLSNIDTANNEALIENHNNLIKQQADGSEWTEVKCADCFEPQYVHIQFSNDKTAKVVPIKRDNIFDNVTDDTLYTAVHQDFWKQIDEDLEYESSYLIEQVIKHEDAPKLPLYHYDPKSAEFIKRYIDLNVPKKWQYYDQLVKFAVNPKSLNIENKEDFQVDDTFMGNYEMLISQSEFNMCMKMDDYFIKYQAQRNNYVIKFINHLKKLIFIE